MLPPEYPVGPCVSAAPNSPNRRVELIREIETIPKLLKHTVEDLSEEQLDCL